MKEMQTTVREDDTLPDMGAPAPKPEKRSWERGWGDAKDYKKAVDAGLSISFEVDVPTGKVGGSLLSERRRREFPW